MKSKKRPKGGKAKKANYQTKVKRIPLPLIEEVDRLIDRFHAENAEYVSRPITGYWWEILGVSQTASPQEVKKAYRILTKRYHPDTNFRSDAQQRIQAINDAYAKSKKR